MCVTRREFESAVSALIERVEAGIVSTLTNAAAFDAERGTALEVCVLRVRVFVFRAAAAAAATMIPE